MFSSGHGLRQSNGAGAGAPRPVVLEKKKLPPQPSSLEELQAGNGERDTKKRRIRNPQPGSLLQSHFKFNFGLHWILLESTSKCTFKSGMKT